MTDPVPEPVPPCATHPWVENVFASWPDGWICPVCGATTPDPRLHTPAQIALVRDWVDRYLAVDSSYPLVVTKGG